MFFFSLFFKYVCPKLEDGLNGQLEIRVDTKLEMTIKGIFAHCGMVLLNSAYLFVLKNVELPKYRCCNLFW